MSWEEVSLKDISNKIQYGYTASAIDNKELPKFLRITDIVNETIDWETVPNCQIDDKNYPKYKVFKGDVLIARTGNTTGYAKLIRDDINSVFASYLIRFQFNEKIALPEYVGRLIESNVFKSYVNQIKSGTAQGGANAKTLSEYKINLPPLPTQKKIASILSTYDDLIENNLKRIKLLEEAAQRLYKEWFVDFKFPNHENTTINPETGLPDGWENVLLNDIADVKSSKRIYRDDYVEKGIPFYRGKEITLKTEYKSIQEQFYISEEKFQILKNKFGAPVEGDILITSVGTIGNAYRVTNYDKDFYFKDGNLIWINNISSELSVFLISYFKSLDFKNIINSISIGSSQKAFTISSLRRLDIVLPKIDILIEYFKMINSIFNQQNILVEKTNLLKEARDLLLPRLMNRTIEV